MHECADGEEDYGEDAEGERGRVADRFAVFASDGYIIFNKSIFT